MRFKIFSRMLPIALLIFFFLLKHVVGIKWLTVASVAIRTQESCSLVSGLIRRQRKICRTNLPVMDGVTRGALAAIDECQFQFRHRRWNCSILIRRKASALPWVKGIRGTREASYVHAISSAGVAHSITSACSRGSLRTCGCDKSFRGKTENGFQWAGCSDNIAFGKAFSKKFIDARERKRRKKIARALVNLHNNEAGRHILEKYMTKQCKCHGVSGSCEVKTCWRAMPSMRTIGGKLMSKFDGATRVSLTETGSRKQLVPISAYHKPHSSSDLVYLSKSPNFCRPSPRVGILGTGGRSCNGTSNGLDGCALLCCYRGYRTSRTIVKERCRCKLIYCCEVVCQWCSKEVLTHRCL